MTHALAPGGYIETNYDPADRASWKVLLAPQTVDGSAQASTTPDVAGGAVSFAIGAGSTFAGLMVGDTGDQSAAITVKVEQSADGSTGWTAIQTWTLAAADVAVNLNTIRVVTLARTLEFLRATVTCPTGTDSLPVSVFAGRSNY